MTYYIKNNNKINKLKMNGLTQHKRIIFVACLTNYIIIFISFYLIVIKQKKTKTYVFSI